ncbi:MAG: dTDP-4-dehydrorhamnose 3,5-epimerase [Bacteroidales bacterium]|jgi:dTDP-4-dehydrorhamnose 3,5-epimerase|nr:dTDP-4-dehydrorhamnose 3,5-epimerase [Bacteroidales bacterium]
MEFIEGRLKGVFVIRLKAFPDHRGFFMRVYDDALFETYGISREWLQENHSLSVRKGTVRGLHFQLPPFDETKLVRCIRGSIYDVFVDIRPSSDTFGQWDSIVLSAENRQMIYIPRGFAHGFCTLEDNCEVLYKADNVYSPEYERGILWNDEDLNINWPVDVTVLSQKDMGNMTWKGFISNELRV